jgi:hypothetical protein
MTELGSAPFAAAYGWRSDETVMAAAQWYKLWRQCSNDSDDDLNWDIGRRRLTAGLRREKIGPE